MNPPVPSLSGRRALCVAALLASGSALAQVPPDAGQTSRELQRPAPPLPREAAPPALRIEQAPVSAPGASASFLLKDVRFTGNAAFTDAELHALVEDALGRDADLAALQRLADRITHYYRAHGYPVARAWLPAQDASGGTVQIAVLEGRYGAVHLRNASKVRDGALADPLAALKPGDPVRTDTLESALLQLRGLPGVDVVSTLKPGAAVGTSDLDVEVRPGKAYDGSVDFDNAGNRYTGEYRLGASLGLNSPLNLGDRLSLRVLGSDERLAYGRIAWQVPVTPQGGQLGFAWSDMSYTLGQDFAALDAHGTARTGSAYFIQPFVTRRAFTLVGQIQYDRKTLEDRIDSTATVTDKHDDVWTASLSGTLADDFAGGGNSGATLAVARGDLAIDTPLALAIDAITAQSDGTFTKTTLNAARLQTLGANTSLYAAVQAQWASGNLDSSEKFSLGGADAVRAYPQGEASGDEGWLFNLEGRYRFAPEWQGALFFDGGRVTLNKNPWVAGDNTRDLSGAGFGLDWAPADWTVKGTLAWRLSGAPTSDTDRTPRLWVQASRRF